MKKINARRLISFFTALFITVSLVTSCNKKPTDVLGEVEDYENEDASTVPVIEKEPNRFAFDARYLDIKLEENTWVQYAIPEEDSLLLVASYYKELLPESASEQKAYENGIRLMVLDRNLSLSEARDFANVYKRDEQSGRARYVNYSALARDDEGSIWALAKSGYDGAVSEGSEAESTGTVIERYVEGVLEPQLSLSVDKVLDDLYVPKEGEWDRAIDRFFFNPDGDILLCGDGLVALMGKDGTPKCFKALPYGNGMGNFVQLADGDVIAICYTYNKDSMKDERRLVRIDSKSCELHDAGGMPFANAYSIFPSENSKGVLVSNHSSLFLYSPEEKTLSEEINWLNSDMNSNRLTVLCGLWDGGALICENSRDFSVTRLAAMHERDNTEEKYGITLGTLYCDDNLTESIIAFNKKSEDYRIFCRDYSIYNTDNEGDGAQRRLSADIVGGSAPDIISLTGIDKYSVREHLAELSEYIDGLPQEDYFQNVLHAGRVGGGVYSIIPAFYLESMLGKASVTEKITDTSAATLKAVRGSFPNASLYGQITSDDLALLFVRLSLKDYIDFDKKTTSLCSDELCAALDLIRESPMSVDWQSFYESMTEEEFRRYESRYAENRVLLTHTVTESFGTGEKHLAFGEETDYVGFVGSKNSAVINPLCELALYNNSEKKDMAFEFLRFLLSEEGAECFAEGFHANKAATLKDMDTICGDTESEKNANGTETVTEENNESDSQSSEEAETAGEGIETEMSETVSAEKTNAEKILAAIADATGTVLENSAISDCALSSLDSFLSGKSDAEETLSEMHEKITAVLGK